MTTADLASKVQQLAGEAARMLRGDPASAAEKLERAHALAMGLDAPEVAAALSMLLARSWSLRRSIVRSIRYARRAVREAPDSSRSHYALGDFYEKAAMRASKSRNTGRAAILYSAAGREFGAAATARTAGRPLASYARAVDELLREAERPSDVDPGSSARR